MNPLTRARINRGLSKNAVATAIGMHRSNYALIESRMEAGETGTIPRTAEALEKFFGNAVTRDQILFPRRYMPVEAKAS